MRKIIHIDMDCFYAAIEERENPSLRGKPIAVGGSGRRGVLTTANYEARRFGCRSAMPGYRALELCPQLVMLPVRFDLYRSESSRIRAIFARFTELIEPLSLDEAYLDVSALRSSGAAVAREIRAQVREETGLTASAGIGPNKLIAKIASDWKKPDGQFEVKPDDVDEFMRGLPVKKLWGVGRRSNERLANLGIETCGDLRRFEKLELSQRLGRWGLELWKLCRGIDERDVCTDRPSKSLSTERTFSEDVTTVQALEPVLGAMTAKLQESLSRRHAERSIRSLVVKLKFTDFERTTAERSHPEIDESVLSALLGQAWARGQGRGVRLLGVGVRFHDPDEGRQLRLEL